jgi:lipopolysaccharide transport system permease protein
MEETVYSADSELINPLRFIRSISSDLRIAPSVAWSLFMRSLRVQYRQTWLGYIWLLMPPLATTLMWVYLSSANILKVGKTGAPYPVYVLTGTLCWQVFAEALNCPLQQLTSARDIVSKTRMPHEALLLAGLIEVLFNFAVRLLITLPVLIWYRSPWNWTFLFVPFGVLLLLLAGLTIGLLLTPVGLLYRDVSRGLAIVVSFWFFLTPVIYPQPLQWPASLLVTLNPVTPLLITTRDWLIWGNIVPAPGFTIVAGLSLAGLAIGWLFYKLATPHIIARL